MADEDDSPEIGSNAVEGILTQPTRNRDWRFFNIIILGISFLFVFTAFQTCSMVETAVLEGAGVNGTSVGSGYISLSIVYGSFAASNWLAPSIVAVIGPKWSMIVGAILYCLYIASFLKPMAPLLYTCSVLNGLGAAIIWTAQGNFLIINSTPETMSRNTGIFWALFQGSLLFGNLFVYFQFVGQDKISAETRYVLYIALTVIAVAGTLLMIVFRKTESELARASTERQSPVKAFKRSVQLLISKEMLLLFACFAYTGFEQSFWGAVFITSVGHTHTFGTMAKRLMGLCGMAVGVGEIIGGGFFGLLGRRLAQCHIGRDTIVLFGYVVHVVCFYLVFISFPGDTPVEESSDTRSYFPSSEFIAVFCAFLLGLGDSSYNTQLYPIISDLFPQDSAPAVALFKFIQSLASAATFVYSQYLWMEWQLLILVVFGTAGTLLLFVAERLSQRATLAGYVMIQESNS